MVYPKMQLHSKGYLNEDRKKGILRLNNALKSALSHQQNMILSLAMQMKRTWRQFLLQL